jgi:hypothetical protein
MRRALGAVALLVLVATAGCAGGIDEEALAENETYDWSTDANATYNITGTEYHAVHRVEGPVELYRSDDVGGERPLSISAVKFRHPNGTVVGAERIEVEEQGSRTVVTPPDNGTLGYTAANRPKRFSTPVVVEGSHEVVLPERMRIGVPVLGVIQPGGAERQVVDGRVHLRWASPGGGIELRYYLQRDLYLFGGLLAGLGALGVGGMVYLYRQIRQLQRRREETGPSVD